MPAAKAAFRAPAPLQTGARIRVVAPGGAFDPAALARGLAILRQWGLVPVTDGLCARHLVYAGDDDARANALASAYADPDAAAFWAVRGGSGTGRILGPTEAALGRALAHRPRWLVGFSDITALHARFAAHGLQSLHGANLVNLPAWSTSARTDLFAALGLGPSRNTRTYPLRLCSGTPPPHLEGPLMGGNLTVLASVVGTGVLPPWQGAVLYLEDVAEAPYRLDRALAQLRCAEALRGVRAVVLGQFSQCGQAATVEAMFSATLAPLGIPLYAGLPWGHEPSSEAAVLGGRVVVAARSSGQGPDHQLRCEL